MNDHTIKVQLGEVSVNVLNYSLITLRENYIHFVTECKGVIKLVLPFDRLKKLLKQLELNKTVDLTSYLGTTALEYKALLIA